MKTLFTEEEFEAANCRQPLTLQCAHCGNQFTAPKNIIQIVLRGNNTRHTLDFCSIVCGVHHRRPPPVTVECAQCHKQFTKQPREIARRPRHFCSRSCNASWQNAHKLKGTRVSKLERWLQAELPRLFPNISFAFNRKDAVGSELDVYVPDLKLAFELNGIHHYAPIYGHTKLKAVRDNDTNKNRACAAAGITLTVVDCSDMSRMNPKYAKRYLDAIAARIRSEME